MGPIYEGTKISIEELCQWLCLETCHAFHAIVYANPISYTSIYGPTCIMTGNPEQGCHPSLLNLLLLSLKTSIYHNNCPKNIQLYTQHTLVTNKMTDVYIELSYLL